MRALLPLAIVLFGLAPLAAAAQPIDSAQATEAAHDTATRPLEDQQRLRNLFESEHVTRHPKQSPEDAAKERADAGALATALKLNCEVSDAAKVATGPMNVDGKTVDTTSYEIACKNGMGYFVTARDPLPPTGFSCFAADATRIRDEAQGIKNSVTCALPANTDLKAAAARVMESAGKSCAVHDMRRMGESPTTHLEYIETACADGQGYIVTAALPGYAAPNNVVTCVEAARHGMGCKLTDAGPVSAPPSVTLETLLAALQQHGVACSADLDTGMRVIGRENTKKRYVVEFTCPERPRGLVAYLPMNGNPEAFEAIDCAEAAKRNLKCQLPVKN